MKINSSGNDCIFEFIKTTRKRTIYSVTIYIIHNIQFVSNFDNLKNNFRYL